MTNTTQVSAPHDSTEGNWIRFDTYATTLVRWAAARQDNSLSQFVTLARELRGTSDRATQVVDVAITDAMCVALMDTIQDGG